MLGSDPIFEVGEFVAVFNQSLEMMYPRVGIVGELANFRVSRGQWVYFDLKDESLTQVKFFGTTRQLPGPLQDGLRLEVFGRPRLHPQYGFSVVIDSIRAIGEGSVKKAQDLLARKLASEGLFEPSRKRALPYAPQRIGLITSKTSAACGDFRKIIDARWGNSLIQLIDVQVQGAASPAQIVEALQAFNEMLEPPEVVVLIRGGGSAEDLASFSDESVVRAVATSRIPTLVAIGHEADFSLAELAADQRASTPSNAAELLVPDKKEERKHLLSAHGRMNGFLQQVLANSLRDIGDFRKMLDTLALQVAGKADDQLAQSSQLLRILNPRAPLRRGYAIVRSNDGRVVRSIQKINPGDMLAVSVSDGTIDTKVLGIK